MTDLAEPVAPIDMDAGVAKRSYLLCATPRTGSYLVADILRRTERAGNPTEYFSDGFQRYWMPRWGAESYPAYLTHVQQAATTANGVLAVKAHPRQLRHFARQETGDDRPSQAAIRGAVDRWLPQCRYIWLRRRDQLRQAVSWAKSMQTNVWWDAPLAPAPFDTPTPAELRFDINFLNAALVRMRREDGMWQQYFAANDIQPLQLWYEDLAADPVGACAAIVQYLQLFDAPLPSGPSDFRRQSDATSERWVRRYRALEIARFEATFSAMAGVDEGADVLVADADFEPSDAWDESRHSLMAVDGYAAAFKPDYRLTHERGNPPDEATASAVRFVPDRAAATAARDIVLPEWVHGASESAAIAAHLGADRVGIPTPEARGASFDIGGTRVLLLDDSPEGLDVEGFLRMPARPRVQHPALEIAVLTGPHPAEWMYGLRNCLAALTRHHCALVAEPAQLRRTTFDVVICSLDDTVESAKTLRYEVFRGSRLRLRAADHHVDVPQPIAWWTRASRDSGADRGAQPDFAQDWAELWSPAIAAAMAA